MIGPERSCEPSRSVFQGALFALLAAVLVADSGCQPSEKAVADSPRTAQKESPDKSGAPTAGKKEGGSDAPAGQEVTAKSVLESMKEAYKKAKDYHDKGQLRVVATVQGGQKVNQTFPYNVAMSAPNRVRLQVYDGEMVCDGKSLFAFVRTVPNQVIRQAAPAKLDIATIFADPIFEETVSGVATQAPTLTFSMVPVQLLLLLADDPLKTITFRAKEQTLVEPAAIEGHKCHRVALARRDGKAVLWIDQESYILRRIELPTEEVLRSAPPEQKLESVSLSAEFSDAKFDNDYPPTTFQYEMPGEAEGSKMLTPTALVLVGKPSPEFSFVGLDHKPIDLKSLRGKITVLDFWATWCEPCRMKLPMDEKVYAKYKSNDKLAFLVVSVNKSETPDKALDSTLKDLKVTIPAARDPQEDVGKKFLVTGIPTTCILGADGVVEDYEPGFRPNHDAELSEKLEKLLGGRSIHGEAFKGAGRGTQAACDVAGRLGEEGGFPSAHDCR